MRLTDHERAALESCTDQIRRAAFEEAAKVAAQGRTLVRILPDRGDPFATVAEAIRALATAASPATTGEDEPK